MFILIVLAACAAVALIGWIIYALTHPILAGQGILIFLCKTAGVISVITAIVFWFSEGFVQAIPAFVFTIGFFFVGNKLEERWRAW